MDKRVPNKPLEELRSSTVPDTPKLDPKIQQQNNMLKKEMGVSGFPTVWFVTPEVTAGKITLKKLDKLGTSRSVTAKIWIENANKILKKQ